MSRDPLQDLARNALLSRSLLEAVGSLSRCLGRRMSESGRPLRLVLLPLLERLADTCSPVRAAAEAALAALCAHCGYPQGLGQLVGTNADYVVDALCRQAGRGIT